MSVNRYANGRPCCADYAIPSAYIYVPSFTSDGTSAPGHTGVSPVALPDPRDARIAELEAQLANAGCPHCNPSLTYKMLGDQRIGISAQRWPEDFK